MSTVDNAVRGYCLLCLVAEHPGTHQQNIIRLSGYAKIKMRSLLFAEIILYLLTLWGTDASTTSYLSFIQGPAQEIVGSMSPGVKYYITPRFEKSSSMQGPNVFVRKRQRPAEEYMRRFR